MRINERESGTLFGGDQGAIHLAVAEIDQAPPLGTGPARGVGDRVRGEDGIGKGDAGNRVERRGRSRADAIGQQRAGLQRLD